MSSFTPMDAYAAFNAKMGEHWEEATPSEGGLYVILEELGIDPEGVTIAIQSELQHSLQLMAAGGISSPMIVAFTVGALWHARQETHESPSAYERCPVCGQSNIALVTLDDPTLGKTVVCRCYDGHRWDRGSGAVIS